MSNKNEIEVIEVGGSIYVANEYEFDDCGFLGGNPCSFHERSFDFCKKIKCTPDKRPDLLNVIYMEKHP